MDTSDKVPELIGNTVLCLSMHREYRKPLTPGKLYTVSDIYKNPSIWIWVKENNNAICYEYHHFLNITRLKNKDSPLLKLLLL